MRKSKEIAARAGEWQMEDITSYVEDVSQGLFRYLSDLDLPTDRVLVDNKERAKAIFLLPDTISKLKKNQREQAHYISKFIACCGAGLFDAALNYLWDETILNLREKIIKYDLDYFYDAIKGLDRDKFRNEDNLQDLPDWQLIEGCMETEIITLIGYKHLNYIRDMRNFASAAHPNQTELTGLMLVSWLDTCIKEVLAKEPSDSAIIVKKLLINIREESFDESNVLPIKTKIEELPKDLSGTLLKSLFGMYVDKDLSLTAKKNIDLIAKSVWMQADEPIKQEIGMRYASYCVNGDLLRKKFASSFLNNVDGLSYLTEDIKSVEIKEKLDNLLSSHYEHNNFYNEEPHAKNLFKYVHETGDVPKSIRYEYVKTLVICRLGNSYGIARSARPYYDEMIKMFQDTCIREFLRLLKDEEVLVNLDDDRLNTFKELARMFLKETKNAVMTRGLEILIKSNTSNIIQKKTYREIDKLIS